MCLNNDLKVVCNQQNALKFMIFNLSTLSESKMVWRHGLEPIPDATRRVGNKIDVSVKRLIRIQDWN